MTQTKYKKKIRDYLQSAESTDEIWDYVLESLIDISATMGLDSLDEKIMTEEELSDHRNLSTS